MYILLVQTSFKAFKLLLKTQSQPAATDIVSSSHRWPPDGLQVRPDPLHDLLDVVVGLFPEDVLQLDVPLRVGEHVRDGPPQRQAGSASLRLDEIPDGAADDPEVV